jgi:hypothetical protein
LATQAEDGSDLAQVPYTPDLKPGNYNETNEKGTHSAFLPNFGYVTTFRIDNVTDFRPDGLQNMAAKNSFKKLNKSNSLGDVLILLTLSYYAQKTKLKSLNFGLMIAKILLDRLVSGLKSLSQ